MNYKQAQHVKDTNFVIFRKLVLLWAALSNPQHECALSAYESFFTKCRRKITKNRKSFHQKLIIPLGHIILELT